MPLLVGISVYHYLGMSFLAYYYLLLPITTYSDLFPQKNVHLFAYMKYFLYLCTRKGLNTFVDALDIVKI